MSGFKVLVWQDPSKSREGEIGQGCLPLEFVVVQLAVVSLPSSTSWVFLCRETSWPSYTHLISGLTCSLCFQSSRLKLTLRVTAKMSRMLILIADINVLSAIIMSLLAQNLPYRIIASLNAIQNIYIFLQSRRGERWKVNDLGLKMLFPL